MRGTEIDTRHNSCYDPHSYDVDSLIGSQLLSDEAFNDVESWLGFDGISGMGGYCNILTNGGAAILDRAPDIDELRKELANEKTGDS